MQKINIKSNKEKGKTKNKEDKVLFVLKFSNKMICKVI